MGGSSQAWKLELDAEWAKTEESLRDAVVYLGIEGLDRVKRKTPVDTGHAQNNWIVNIGSPDTSDKASAKPAGGAKATDTFASANASILAGYPKDGSFPVIYLQNNLPYALALEYGHSAQAPAGMVAMTVAELEALMSGIEI